MSQIFQMCSPLRKYTGGNPNIYTSDPSGIPTPVYLVKNHPLPITKAEALEIRLILSVLAALFILVPLCYIPASFVSFVVREREIKSKHLQLVSGISPQLYWISTYVWDLLLYSVLTGLAMGALFVYGKDSASVYTETPESTTAMFLLILLYGFSSLPSATHV